MELQFLYQLVVLIIGIALGYGIARSILKEEINRQRTQLNASQIQCAQLTERADRVPAFETQIASLQSSLQEETNKSAALIAQSERIPDLEQRLHTCDNANTQLIEQVADLRQQLGALTSTLQGERDRLVRMSNHITELTTANKELIDNKQQLATKVAELATALDEERKQSSEKLALLKNAEERLTPVFQSLANGILEEKSSRFTERNKINIEQILGPLNTKIQEFQTKVDTVYHQDSNDRTALKEQITQLMGLSERVSDDAKNLAEALKGSSKTQGNWGELILEHVLEASGLRKGHEYALRETYQYEDGTRGQPDVVINLPEDRHLIIDSKVSLTDYERYTNADDDENRKNFLDAHAASVQRHIKELSEKNYPTLYGLNSLDLVVMFVPLEPAFAVAIATDKSLWEKALRKNVLLVSPSSLLFVLRTVAYLWRQEAQARNVQEIAKCGADLYDKFVGFVADMRGLGNQLHKAERTYGEAFKKLHDGSGNLVSRAEKLKTLGVAPKKSLPPDLIETALEEPLIVDNIAASVENSESAGSEEL